MNDAPNTVDVLLTGNTLPGADIEQTADAFAGLMRISPEQARALITGGKLKLLRRGLSPEKGLAATSRLASLGIEAVMRPGAPAKPAARETPQPPPTEAQPAQPVPPPPPPKPELPQTFVNSIGMEFVLIPAGSFLMGSPDGVGDSNEHPQHQVVISRPFYLGKYQVTQAQWQAIMGNNPSKFHGPTCPVERVSWNDAQQFITQLITREGDSRYRLPTEAEWEYACRAGTNSAYCFGEDADQLGRYAWHWNNGKAKSRTQSVGQKVPNSWGLHDTHGNVWEWVWDWYNDRSYDGNRSSDPLGPPSGEQRVTRGGSWGSDAKFCRSASRDSANPDKRANTIGFRLAMTAEASTQTTIDEPPKAPPVSAHVAPAPAGWNVPHAPTATASVPPVPTVAATPATSPASTGRTAYVPPSGESMTFGKAVSTCFKKFADFSGRASRAEFWFFHLFDWLLCLGGFLVMCLLASVVESGGLAGNLAILADSVIIIAAFVLALPCFAVAARRLHDTDRSGAFLLLYLVPLGGIVLFVWFLSEGTPGPNRFG